MRCTQYIGLTQKAKTFIAEHQFQCVKNSQNWCSGMFGEMVCLGEWWDANNQVYIREIVQAEPWSSGPMIFTTIAITKDKAEGEIVDNGDGYGSPIDSENLKPIEGMSWIEDSSLRCQFDVEKGLFWI